MGIAILEMRSGARVVLTSVSVPGFYFLCTQFSFLFFSCSFLILREYVLYDWSARANVFNCLFLDGIGLPAFKPGEKVEINLDMDDI